MPYRPREATEGVPLANDSHRDLYEVLGVPRSADADALKKAYRRLARDNHPDTNPDDPEAEERFKQISEAYSVLSTPARRAAYDEFGALALDPNFDAEAARQSGARFGAGAFQGFGGHPGAQGFQFSGGAEGGFEDWLGDMLFGGGGRQRGPAAPRQAPDAHAELAISFREAALGTERSLALDRPNPTGEPIHEKLNVTIPTGVEDGARIRLAGKGGVGAAGHPDGDLIVTLRVRPDPVFKREGSHLHLDVPIGVSEAVLGSDVEVPTLDGRAKLHIPAGTDGGSTLRLRGKGVPAGKGRPAGDLYVHVRIRVPRDLDSEGRDAFEKLADLDPADLRSELFRG